MSSAIHRKVMEQVDPSLMLWVLEDSLDEASLAELCRSCSLSWEGGTGRPAPAARLIEDLAAAFYRDEGHAQTILKALRRANEDVLSEFDSLSPKQIERIVSDEARLLAEDRVGNVALALALDARPEVTDLLQRLLDQLRVLSQGLQIGAGHERPRTTGTRAQPDSVRKPHPKSAQPVSPPAECPTGPEALNAVLQRKLAERQEECRALAASVDALKSENAALGSANRAVQEEKTALEERIKHIEEEGDSALLAKILRENRAPSDGVPAAQQARSLDPFMVTLAETVLELKSYVEAAAVQNAEERRGVRQVLEEVRKMATEPLSAARPARAEARPADEHARVGLFVDVQNMFYGAKEFNARLDFSKLLKRAVGNRRLIKAIAYVVQSPEVDQTGFIAMLGQKNYEVKRKDLRFRSDGSAKGDWDMGMAIDVLNLADKLDVVVLVTGDGDFVALVESVKTLGPYVEVFSFDHNTSRDLALAADRYFPIQQDLLLRVEENAS